METQATTIRSDDEQAKQATSVEPTKAEKRAMKIRLKSGVTAGHMIAVHL